jgi:Peptidase family C25/Propeptide_C25
MPLWFRAALYLEGYMKRTILQGFVAIVLCATLRAPSVTAPQSAHAIPLYQVAYVYRSDASAASDFGALLNAANFVVTAVPLASVLSTDFSKFDAAVIADDTGYLDDWGSAAGQVTHIANATQVMGIGEGGYAFLGKLGLHIGWPNGAHNSEAGVRGDATLSFYKSPNDLTAALNPSLPIFQRAVSAVEVFLPQPMAGVTGLGQAVAAPANQNPDHYWPLIAERCHQLWGFRNPPGDMSAQGRALFVNALNYLLSKQCVTSEQSCALRSAITIPGPDRIDFDEQTAGTPLNTQYQAATGASFQFATAQADASASSAANVARVAPSALTNPAIAINFDSPKTHVGFTMGNGGTAAPVGTLTAFDAAGNIICQVSDTVPQPHSKFIGAYDPQRRIMRVTLSYSIGNESLDDLLIAPGKIPFTNWRTPARPPINPDDIVGIDVLKSDNTGFSAKFAFPALQYFTHSVIENGVATTYTQVLLPNQEVQTGEPGLPDVPIYRRVIGVPEGATVKVKGVSAKLGIASTVLLLPAQPQAVDQVEPIDPDEDDSIYASKPFTKSVDAYASDVPFPKLPAQVVPLGKMRDLHLVQLDIAAGQFNPKNKLFTPFESIEIDLEFAGGTGGFLPGNKINHAFEDHFAGIYDQALNTPAFDDYPLPDQLAPDPLVICGEYLIITAPAFAPAAKALRDWKVQKGISTFVVETGNGAGKAGTTNAQIHQFIAARFNSCVIRPSYLLLLGDTDHIPTYIVTGVEKNSDGEDVPWASDLGYALMQNPFYDANAVAVIPLFQNLGLPVDYLPDLAYGRIPVDSLAEANIVVNKIIAYEKTPPLQTSFYSNMSFASYFQCCRNDVAQDGTDTRSFLETSEHVRGILQAVYGFSVERIYTANRKYHDEAEEGLYPVNRSAVPNRYRNGALLPVDLRASSGYAWDGNETDIIAAINSGRNLVLHRDHAGADGWGDPKFRTNHVASLTNANRTPVIYSINCSSGRFDGGDWWAEEILAKENGGAVGIIGDTRVSPTWANSALTRGLFDATWPMTVPAYGSLTKSRRRLGDILNYGKLYLLAQVGVPQSAGSVSWTAAFKNINIYHVLGDPTMELWTVKPELNLPGINLGGLTVGQTGIDFNYPAPGAEITALQDGVPVGRAVVAGDGSVQLAFKVTPKPGLPIQLSASKEDKVSVPLGQIGSHRVSLPLVTR